MGSPDDKTHFLAFLPRPQETIICATETKAARSDVSVCQNLQFRPGAQYQALSITTHLSPLIHRNAIPISTIICRFSQIHRQYMPQTPSIHIPSLATPIIPTLPHLSCPTHPNPGKTRTTVQPHISPTPQDPSIGQPHRYISRTICKPSHLFSEVYFLTTDLNLVNSIFEGSRLVVDGRRRA
jgi:hypothetical protein